MSKHTLGPWYAHSGDAIVSPNFPNGGVWVHGLDKLFPPVEAQANARLIAAAPDDRLLLQAICLGVARWEFFTDDRERGEVCCNGLRYSTRLSDLGTPIIAHHNIRHALTEAIAKAEASHE